MSPVHVLLHACLKLKYTPFVKKTSFLHLKFVRSLQPSISIMFRSMVLVSDRNTMLFFRIRFAFVCFSSSHHTHYLKYSIKMNTIIATINEILGVYFAFFMKIIHITLLSHYRVSGIIPKVFLLKFHFGTTDPVLQSRVDSTLRKYRV
jgi:hypothetical protein